MGPLFSLRTDPIKDGAKVINSYRINNNHACSLPQNGQIYACLFVAGDNIFKLFRKLSFTDNLSESIDKVAIKFKFGQTILQKDFKTNDIRKFRMTAIKLR